MKLTEHDKKQIEELRLFQILCGKKLKEESDKKMTKIDIKNLPEHLKNIKVNEPLFALKDGIIYKVLDENKKLKSIDFQVRNKTIEFYDTKELYFQFINGNIMLAFEDKANLEFVFVNQDDRPKEKPMT